MAYAGFMIQTTVQVAALSYCAVVDAAEHCVQLLYVNALDYRRIGHPVRSQLIGTATRSQYVGDATFHRVDAHFEDTGQFLDAGR